VRSPFHVADLLTAAYRLATRPLAPFSLLVSFDPDGRVEVQQAPISVESAIDGRNERLAGGCLGQLDL
jgi:hypothetical protein